MGPVVSSVLVMTSGFPGAPGKPWKPGKMTVTFPVMEISWKFKFLKNIIKKWEETWKMRFSVIANTLFSFLAHLVMSLCNHALSIMWCCCCWHWHLCTALPVTALIIETSYLANICSYTPNICTWNIRPMWCIFFKW